MLQATPTRESGTTWVGAIYEDKQRRKLMIAVLLLLAAITAVLVRDYKASANSDRESEDTAAAQPVYAPSTPKPVLQAPAAETTLPVAAKSLAKATSGHVRSSHAKTSRTWGPATAAAQQTRTTVQAQAHQQPPSYPLLTEASAIQGSVLLQAMIGADGAVEEMRVISGPAILVSAARQAVQQWRFKPYLVNGKPVETYARVTVNFSIDVSNTEARYHLNSVTSTPAL